MRRLLHNRVLWLLLFAALALLWPSGAAIAGASLAFGFGATTDVTDINEAMKIFFTDPIVTNVVNDTELMNQFMEDNNVQIEQSTGGRYIETAQYFRLPSGYGFRAPGDYLPVPGAPSIKNSRVFLKKGIGVVEMTGDVMERVRGDMGAYLDYMDRALPDFLENFNNNVDRACYGYGNGAKARIDAINGLVITLKSSYGVTGWSDAWLAFTEGERIVASADADGNPLRNAGSGQSAEVTDIDDEANTITVDAIPGAWAPDDFLFNGDPSGASSQTSAGDDREIMGLAGMVDDGSILPTFQNLARASYRLWRSVIIDGGQSPFSGTLDEDVLVHADNQTFVLGKGKPNLVVTSRRQADNYWRTLRGDRVLIDPKAYEGGRSGLFVRLGDRLVPIKVARKMPVELCYMLQTDTFKRWQLDGGKWDDKTGAIWNRVTDGTGRKDDFFSVYIWYVQLGNLAPRKSCRIENLAA
jgi:hypothetical protein